MFSALPSSTSRQSWRKSTAVLWASNKRASNRVEAPVPQPISAILHVVGRSSLAKLRALSVSISPPGPCRFCLLWRSIKRWLSSIDLSSTGYVGLCLYGFLCIQLFNHLESVAIVWIWSGELWCSELIVRLPMLQPLICTFRESSYDQTPKTLPTWLDPLLPWSSSWMKGKTLCLLSRYA